MPKTNNVLSPRQMKVVRERVFPTEAEFRARLYKKMGVEEPVSTSIYPTASVHPSTQNIGVNKVNPMADLCEPLTDEEKPVGEH
jgi:hypothetical protein